MTTTQRRSRIVMFRVSEPEYSNLRQACDQSGARSISEFARTVMLERVKVSEVNPDLVGLRAKIEQLECQLKSLAHTLGLDNP